MRTPKLGKISSKKKTTNKQMTQILLLEEQAGVFFNLQAFYNFSAMNFQHGLCQAFLSVKIKCVFGSGVKASLLHEIMCRFEPVA